MQLLNRRHCWYHEGEATDLTMTKDVSVGGIGTDYFRSAYYWTTDSLRHLGGNSNL